MQAFRTGGSMDRCQGQPTRLRMQCISAAFAFAFAAILLLACPAFAEAADTSGELTTAAQQKSTTTQTKAKKTGWAKTKAGKVYYRDGELAKGITEIKGTYYYFNSKGVLQMQDVCVNGIRLYISKNGAVFGAQYKDAYYYENLKRMTKVDAYEFETYLMARDLVASLYEKGDSKAKMRRKAFDWVVAQDYTGEHWWKTGTSKKGWIAYYARLVYEGKGGNCYGMSTAYCYMLAAIGDSPTFFVDRRPNGSHSWLEMGGKRYDPVYAKWQGYKYYYAAEGRGNFADDGSWFEYSPTEEHQLPEFSSSHAAKNAKTPAALLSLGKASMGKKGTSITYYENGEQVKGAWRTIASKRYYFKKDGNAATGSYRIDGTYYVFNAKGVLLTKDTEGVRTVKVSGETYRVNQDGIAAPGWSTDGKRYYLKNGKMVAKTWRTIRGAQYYFKSTGEKATGPTKIGKVYYLFNEKGVLLKGTSSKGSLVAVGSSTYRIDKTGRAVSGWSADRKKRFGKSGLLLKGTRVIGGQFYAADSEGNYLAELTEQLNAASATGTRATALRRLLEKPVSELYTASCGFAGDDGMWEYKRFYVLTARPATVAARYATIDDVIAAEDASEADAVKGDYETIVSIVAK